MLDSLPEETTQLLIDLCTSSGPLLEPDEEMPNTAASTKALFSAGSTGPSYLSYLALNRNSVILDAPPPSPSIKTVKPGDTASRRDSVHEPTPPQTPSVHTVPHRRPPPPLKQPPKLLSPRIYFAHFVDHMDQFIIFLETVAQRRWGQSVDAIDDVSVAPEAEPFPDEHDRPDQVAVWNTLLELYLTLPDPPTASSTSANGATKDTEGSGPLRRKALRVLKSKTLPYDPTHALILCSSRGYTRGLVLLWERMGMYEDVLRFWMDSAEPGASDEVVRRLAAYGSTRPQLYLVVLRYLTSTPALLARHEADVRGVLEHIDKEQIATPLGIIQVLARNDVASVGLVKDWLMTRIQTARSEIQSVCRVPTSSLNRAHVGATYRTRSGRRRTAWRRPRSSNRSRTWRIPNIRACSMLHGALAVVGSSICRVCTSCATTAFTSRGACTQSCLFDLI